MVEVLSGVKLVRERDAVLLANSRRKKGFEPKSIRLWSELSSCGGLVVDAGAYTGFYSILASLSGARVVAYEPNAVAVARMKENIEINGVKRIVIRRRALSDRDGDASLYGRAPMSSAGNIVSGDNRLGSVRTCRLDGEGLSGVAAIKIDVERSELALLRGAMQTIESQRPHILIEALDGADDIDSILLPLRYSRSKLDAGMYHYCP